MTDAPSDRATGFARQLTERAVAVVGTRVLAVILHGSLALGSFTPGRSDVDLLTVVDEPLADADVEALRRLLDAHSRDAPHHVDVRVVTRAVAASPT